MAEARGPELTEAEAAERLATGRAWEEFCDALKGAGRLVLDRAPERDLDRAEGFRYLTRLTRMAFKLCLEHADPAAPRLVQYMDPTQKFGVDNPDQLYLWARIGGAHSYRLHGPRGTARYYGIGVYAGSAGRGGRRTVAHLDADALAPGADGGVDVILSPREHPGNWVALPPDTTTLLVRQTVDDPAVERPAWPTLERLATSGPPPPLRPSQVVKGLERASRQVVGSLRMFSALADGWRARPNALHPMDARMAAESFGDPDFYYAGGYWKLEPDEALVIEFAVPRCRYWGFLLCNAWTESLDYRYRPVSANRSRAVLREDGTVCLAVADRDPGLRGVTWLDTEGHREGTMTLRWLLAETTPVPVPRVVPLAELAEAVARGPGAPGA
jgi:hypothetical protein